MQASTGVASMRCRLPLVDLPQRLLSLQGQQVCSLPQTGSARTGLSSRVVGIVKLSPKRQAEGLHGLSRPGNSHGMRPSMFNDWPHADVVQEAAHDMLQAQQAFKATQLRAKSIMAMRAAEPAQPEGQPPAKRHRPIPIQHERQQVVCLPSSEVSAAPVAHCDQARHVKHVLQEHTAAMMHPHASQAGVSLAVHSKPQQAVQRNAGLPVVPLPPAIMLSTADQGARGGVASRGKAASSLTMLMPATADQMYRPRKGRLQHLTVLADSGSTR